MEEEELEYEEAKALAVIEAKLSETNDSVEKARIRTPVESVENSLAVFARDSFEVIRSDYEFHQKIQNEVGRRLEKFTENQLIALLSNDSVNLNDRVSKVMAPTFGLITSKQQAEMAAKQKDTVSLPNGKVSMDDLNRDKQADLLNGMKALNDLLGSLQSAAARQKSPEAIEMEAGPDTRDVTETDS
jgi:hypothetical protein